MQNRGQEYKHSVWTQVKKVVGSSWLQSQIINIKLKKNQQEVPGPPPKLLAFDWRTCGHFQHCTYGRSWLALLLIHDRCGLHGTRPLRALGRRRNVAGQRRLAHVMGDATWAAVHPRILKTERQKYRKISNISGTKSPNLNVSRLVLQLSLSNPMQRGVKSRMKI